MAKRKCRAIVIIMVVLLLGWIFWFFVLPYIMPVKVYGIFVPYNYILSGNHVELYEYKGDEEVVVIPERVFFRKVTMLQDVNSEIRCFQNNQTIRKVVMPDSITSISPCTFQGCSNLEEVILSRNLEEISSSAFQKCKKLRGVNFYDGLKKIENSAFFGCTSITEIKIPNTVEEIGQSAFWGTGLETVYIPDTVKKVSGSSFWGTPWYEAQTEEFVEVGTRVLIKYNGNEKEVRVPEGITYIGSMAFAYNETVERIVVPESVEEICFLGICSNEALRYVELYNDSIILDRNSINNARDNGLTILAREGSSGQKLVENYSITDSNVKDYFFIWEELNE